MTDNKEIQTDNREKKIAKILAISFALFIFTDFLAVSFIYSWADWVATLIFSLLFITPAYFSNAGMVITGGGQPIDGGKNFIDGRRLFGDHKTWRGLLLGPLFIGIPISMGIFIIFIILWPFIAPIVEFAASIDQYQLYTQVSTYQYYFTGGPLPLGLLILVIRIVMISFGASFGDLFGSFLKRRFNIGSGRPFWIIDQLDFALFSILLSFIPSIFFPELFIAPDWNIFIFLIILTPAVSIIANTVAYIIGLKEVPW